MNSAEELIIDGTEDFDLPHGISEEITRDEIEQAQRELEASKIDSNTFLVSEENGVREILHYDPGEEKFHLEIVEDVESVMEWCKGRFNEGLANSKCEFRMVGSYPTNIVEIFAKKNGLEPRSVHKQLAKDVDLTRRLLNDSDLSAFRTLAGRY